MHHGGTTCGGEIHFYGSAWPGEVAEGGEGGWEGGGGGGGESGSGEVWVWVESGWKARGVGW